MSKHIKFATLILIVSATLVLTGCGQEPAPEPADGPENAPVADQTTDATNPAAAKTPAPAAKTPAPAKAPAPVAPASTAYTASGGFKATTVTYLFGGPEERDGLSHNVALKVAADGSVTGTGVFVIDFKPESEFGNGKDGRMDMVFSGTTEGNRIGGLVVTTGQDLDDETGAQVYINTVQMGWVAEKSGNSLNGQIYNLESMAVTMEFTATIK